MEDERLVDLVAMYSITGNRSLEKSEKCQVSSCGNADVFVEKVPKIKLDKISKQPIFYRLSLDARKERDIHHQSTRCKSHQPPKSK